MGLTIIQGGERTAIPLAIEAAGGDAIGAYLIDPEAAMSEFTGRSYSEPQLNAMTVEDLQALLTKLGMTEEDIDGSGSEGRNLKADYIRAILAAQGGEG